MESIDEAPRGSSLSVRAALSKSELGTTLTAKRLQSLLQSTVEANEPERREYRSVANGRIVTTVDTSNRFRQSRRGVRDVRLPLRSAVRRLPAGSIAAIWTPDDLETQRRFTGGKAFYTMLAKMRLVECDYCANSSTHLTAKGFRRIGDVWRCDVCRLWHRLPASPARAPHFAHIRRMRTLPWRHTNPYYAPPTTADAAWARSLPVWKRTPPFELRRVLSSDVYVQQQQQQT